MLEIIITLAICATVLLCVYRITEKGLSFHVLHENKAEETQIVDAEEDNPKANLDGVLKEIYDAFDISVDNKE